ncbi:hypothetical protein A2716_01075 [candidate division WWE3 bacterium RIFCSPHIGHO2_01_FULL_40_23]|uniref:Major facilitator superfamily (MFS) profile domain-containing protein n=1 Tax=candidate division WWE3 bacterium RIFCSPLOWO2_01_FULL_41_18 TaxID=1802625 RepID=A0A1F4VF81_UNCKA|nr:MAG: hypothetical protein A2716_01075 [candidate division WWE3 bacterium RIFCSPHIGHO2_01_FULL_40_23]OGC55580.1 MAG: hypothetical protein A3A78_01345 [candidate division WWE3 bacterium RIFCSPLOWO2_01_FULL_41_18]
MRPYKHHFSTLLHLPRRPSEFLSLLYLVAVIRNLVFILLNLFLPIFVFKIFLELGSSEKEALILIGLTFLYFQTVHGILTFAVSKVISHYGTKVGFIIGQVALSGSLYMLFHSKSLEGVFASFLIWAVAAAFYWISYHTFFLEMGKPGKFGEELGLVEMLTILTGLTAPALTGALIALKGPQILFTVCVLLILVTLVLILLVKDNQKLGSVGLKTTLLDIRGNKRDFISFIGAGGQEIIYSVAWPLILFAVFKNYLEVGIIASIILLTSGLTSFFVGKLSDHVNKVSIEKIGSAVISATFIGRVFFQTPLSLYALDSIYKIFSSAFNLPLEALAYTKAVDGDKVRYIVFRELGYKAGGILGMVSFLVVLYLGLSFWWTFAFAALFSLLPMAARQKNFEA